MCENEKKRRLQKKKSTWMHFEDNWKWFLSLLILFSLLFIFFSSCSPLTIVIYSTKSLKNIGYDQEQFTSLSVKSFWLPWHWMRGMKKKIIESLCSYMICSLNVMRNRAALHHRRTKSCLCNLISLSFVFLLAFMKFKK